ncbi:recombinase family protein [Roseibium sp.]|uniref:recombinase family protein n=1 Tax=Roseibium sp. TaxID=1936156 RepID=UPI003D9C59BC
MTKTAIIYARYSDEKQNEQTIEAQISACEEYAKRQGWTVGNVFSDYSTTGSYFKKRPGIHKFLERAKRGDIHVAICTATDRLSRDGEHSHHILKALTHHGVELHTSQSGKVDTLEFGIRAAIAEDYLKQTAAKTRDGMRYTVGQGRLAGGLSYGYKVKQIHDANGDRIPGYREIVPEQASIIRRIFEDYANGKSPQKIATELNEEGIPGPRGKFWRDTAIRGHVGRGTGILNNELYLGRIVWNRQKFSKDPETETRKARLNDKDQWVHGKIEDLEIVPVELWNRVKERQHAVNATYNKSLTNPLNAKQRPKYLLSRRLECAECGGPYAIMARERYGCTNHKKKLGCQNSRTITRQNLEQRVLKAFPRSMFSITNLNDLTDKVNRQRKASATNQSGERAALEREVLKVEKKIQNTAEAIAIGAGAGLATLTQMLGSLEGQKTALEKQLQHLISADTEVELLSEAIVTKVMVAALETMATMDMSKVDPQYRDPFFSLIQKMIQKVIIAPNPIKGVDLMIHGRLATILATLEAWHAEEANLTEKYKQEYLEKCAAGTLKTDEEEAAFIERVNTELESKRRSYERLQVSVVAGAGFEPATFRL